MKKMIRIQYPDKNIHDIEVYDFYKTENGMYCIEYYDTYEQSEMYTVLLNINNVLVKDPNNKTPYDDLTQNSTKLDLNILPGYIPCITLINQNKTQTQTQRQFIVYVDQSNNKYIDENVANKYGIPNRGGKIVVDGINYIKVYQSDIDDIIKKSKNTEVPEYRNYYNKQSNNNDEYQQTQEQDNPTKNVHIHHIISYYCDQNNKYYLDREGLVIARNYNIEIEGKPIIILDKNCYSILESQLDELKRKSINTHTWIKNGVITKDNKTKEKAILSTYICRINKEIFIPLDTYTKYKERKTQKLIKVNGKLYINITENDLSEIKRLYNNDNIDLILAKKEVIRKNKELDNILNNKSPEQENHFQK